MNATNSTTTTTSVHEQRDCFYNGAQYLYAYHFTTMHPFPAREVMNEAMKRYPDPQELRTVTILGNKYRVKDGAIEILTGAANQQEWARAVLITPAHVKALADLIEHPYEQDKAAGQ